MSYEIFADVSIDIDREYAEKNHLRYIPMEYMLGEESHNCTSPESDEMMHHYYDKLRAKVTTRTSQITPFHYVDALEELVKEGKDILYICLSSGLSDTYESAHVAVAQLKEDYPNASIEIVDSLGATGGMGLLAESAIENRKKGMSLEENASWLRAHAKEVNLWFKVEDLMYLKRGGRVSAATAILGTALNLKPMLTVNALGKLDTVTTKRGNKMAFRYLLEKLQEGFKPELSPSVYISCADCMGDAEQLKALIMEKVPEAQVHITMLSPIIGAHTGPDMISVIFYGKERA